MEELIKITEHKGNSIVSARDLHDFLESKRDFSNWISDRIKKYGLVENEDYTSFNKIVERENGGTTRIEYALTLDTAKELAMVEGNAKGKQARKYFIACEKKLIEGIRLKEPTAKELALMVIKSEEEKERLLDEIKQLEPKKVFADAVSCSSTSILIGELAKILKQNGVDMGQNRLFEWLRINGYLIKRLGSDFNMPTQISMEKMLFEIKETSIAHSDGHTTISKTPKVTGAGQLYFVNLFLRKNSA